MNKSAAGKPSPIRLGFAAKSADSWMGQRARGLARYLGPDIRVTEYYQDTAGWRGKWRCFRELLRAGRNLDVLYLISMHPVRLLAGWLCRRLFGTKIVVDTGDHMYEEAKTRGDSRWRCRLVALWEAVGLRVPDALVVRGSYHQELLCQQGFNNVTFIPDGVDCSDFHPREERNSHKLREELGLAGKVIVGLLSGIAWEPHLRIPSPGWDLVACLARLRDLPLHGLVVGDGPGLLRLQELCRDQALANRVTFLGRVPYDRVPDYLGAMDIFLHTALNNPMSRVRTTGKLPVLLAAGCTALVSAVGEAHRVLNDTGMLLPFDGSLEEYAEALARKVRQLVETGNFQEYRKVGPDIARSEFDYQVLSPRLDRLLRQLASVH